MLFSYEEVVRLPTFKEEDPGSHWYLLVALLLDTTFLFVFPCLQDVPTSIASLPGACNLPPCLLPTLFLKKVGGSERKKRKQKVGCLGPHMEQI